MLKNSTMNFSRFIMCFALLLLGSGSLFGQVSGTKTIPTDYATIADFITAINTAGIGAGGVTLDVPSGYTETAPVGGFTITATGTVANPIVIHGVGGAPKPIITASAGLTAGALNDGIIKLIGSDYVTISGLDLRENAANTTTAAATNNMTEWGIALLYASATDGAQRNVISSNDITLNRTYTNTFGIYSNVRHTSTVVGTAADITAPSGSNSFNQVYSNIISNVNYGIVFNGSAIVANMDTGNDIGGTSAGTGNNISNYATAAAASTYINLTGSNYGIFVNHQLNNNISYNTLVSATHTATNTLGGILQNFSTTTPNSATVVTLNNNTVTLSKSAASGAVIGLNYQGITTAVAGSSLTMNNNSVINCVISGVGSSAGLTGLTNLAAFPNVTMNGNTVSGNTSTATSGTFTGIANSGVVTGTLNMQNNFIGTASNPAITFSVATSGSLAGIANTTASSTATVNITGNDFRGFVQSVIGSGGHTYISNAVAVLNLNVSNNTFTNLTAATTAGVTFIAHSYSVPASGTQVFNNNSIVTGFNKTGAGGTVNITTTNGSSGNGTTATYTNNNFSNITLTGATTFVGFNNTDGTGSGTTTKTFTGNTINNLTGGTSPITLLNMSYFNGACTISGNTFTNVSGQGSVTGMSINASLNTANPLNINSNTIFGLSSTGAGASVVGITSSNTSPLVNISNNDIHGLSSTGASLVSGVGVSGATLTNVNANRIYGLSSSNAGGTVYGISITGGSAVNTSNNVISALTAPIASGADVIRGINVNSSSSATYGVYYNSVYLSGTSSGTNFGTSGIYHQSNATASTAALDMRNNIIINETTPVGTGIAVAYRRSAAALNNYASSSNRNLFYAGTPSATHLIMFDGTTSYQTLPSYQTAIVPRDANSITGEAAFTGSGYGTAGNFFINLTGASSDFLRPVAGIVTQVEGGAGPVTSPSITTDFTGATRPSTPDMGAYEFSGTTPAPVITLNSVTPPTTTQCVATARLVSVNITTSAGTITGATIGYSVNGVPQSNIVMTNVSGSTWEGTIPAPTPSNAVIAWGVAAMNSLGINGGYTGTTYSDAPLFGSTASATASVGTVCSGNPSDLTAKITKAGSVQLGSATTGTSTAGITPFNSNWEGSRTQYLIRASELQAIGLAAGNITNLGLIVTASGAGTFPQVNYTIKMAHTANTVLASAYGTPTGAFTTVFTSASEPAPAVGIKNYTLSTAFNWDGVSNILVDICHDNDLSNSCASCFSSSSTVQYSVTSFNSVWGSYADNTASCGVQAATTVSTFNNRPNLIFTGNVLTPITSVTWMDGATTVGTGNPLTVSPTTTTTYTANITALGCVATPAPTVTVNVNPLPSAPTAVNSAQCGTQVPTANVTSTTGVPTPTFKWYSASTGGTVMQNSTSTTYTTAVSVTTTFYVSEVNTVTGCESPRTPVTVNVSTPDAISASASVPSVCANGSVTLTAANTNPTPFQSYTYSWVSTTGSGAETPVAGNPVTIIPTTAGTYTYTVTGTDGGCVTTNTVSVTVNPNPTAVVAGANDTDICNGQLVNLSVTSTTGSPINPVIVLAQNFDAGLGAWTTTYSGTAPAGSGWLAQNAPFSYTTYFNNFATPQGGGFAMTNGDIGGSGLKTRAALISPTFSTVGMSSATLTFQNLYQKWNSGDSLVRLEISTNGGTSWTTLKDYLPLGSQGVVTSFGQVPANESIVLGAPYLNQSNLRLRYNYVTAWGYYWVIDDVKVTSTPVDPTTYAWTSTPAGFTSSVQNPTGVAPSVTTNYSVNITNSFGCSAIGSVNVVVNQPTSSTVSATACDTYTWPINSATYTTSGTHTAIIPNAAGCDSTITLNLTIKNSTSATVSATACSTYTWPINSQTYTTSGTHTATIPNAAGCDSVITLNLTINNPTSATVNLSACNSYTWPLNSTTYTSSGTHTATIMNAAGCDSVVTLNLTINTPTTGTDVQTACGSYTWIDGTTYVASNNTATFTIVGGNSNGCDSIVTLNLTILQPATGTDTQVACGSYTWIDGVTYVASNSTATHTIVGGAANGCDSIVTLNLTINQPTTSSVLETACTSYTWAENGTTYTTSGAYVTTLAGAAANGCDSIITLNLTIIQPTTSSVSATACTSYTWAQNGMTYTTSGMYNDTIPNAAGCDSIITLNLTINNATTSTVTVSTCNPTYTWAQNGTVYNATGMYNDTITNAAGCDSIVTLNLTIAPFVATATDNGNATITASAGTTYQWINCTTNTAIAGATTQTFTATANGTYAAVVSNGTCSDTTNCVNITNVGIKENTISTISVHPNPTHDFVIVTMDASSAIVEVMDVQGKLVQTAQIKSGDQIDLGAYERGVYTLRIKTESGTSIERIVKN